ncbi:MAG TPA: sulfurtransferase [Bacteroidota bacterium]|nr:sulfurtransferase [Bacteroidota bacterium]
MKLPLALLVTIAIFHGTALSHRSPNPPPRDDSADSSLLVTTSWLAKHLSDADLILLHVGSSGRQYKKGHIPGARYVWPGWLSQSNSDLTLELPSALQADSVLKNLGVSVPKHLVLYYERGNITQATRVLYTLEYLGLGGRISLLNGGFDLWKAEGRLLSVENPAFPEGKYRAMLHPEVVVDAQWVQQHLQDRATTIVDARSAQFYEGRDGGMPRPGHIPGAVNIPFSSVIDSTNRLKSLSALRSLFDSAGVRPGSCVVTYCHIGQQASLLYFVAKLLGYDARLYDGSFEDWSSREDLPLTPPGAAPDRGK